MTTISNYPLNQPIKRKAYLLAWIDTTKFPLVIERLTIHSDGPSNITRIMPGLIFTVHTAEAPTFQEAHDKIIEDINSSFLFKELRPYFHSATKEYLEDELQKYVNTLLPLAAKVLGAKEES